MYVATRRKYTPHPDDFTLGKWEAPVVIGACLWLAIEVSIFLFPADFRTAQLYTVGSLVVGLIVFAVVWATRRSALTAEPGVEVDSL